MTVVPDPIRTGSEMTRSLVITWAVGEKVGARLAMPAQPKGLGILLAHGAGAGQDHSFMVALRDGLAAAGHPTLTFDYPYMAAERKAPDRLPTLLACHRAAADRLAAYTPRLVLAGKSMGGRVGSHLAGDEGYPAAGLVYLGYPLVALGKSEPRDTAHLDRIAAPQLFVSGTRDRLGPLPLIEAVVKRVPAGTLETVAEGDHSFRVPKRTGRSPDQVMAAVVDAVAGWAAAIA